ncbi:hypothetical protein [Phormidesmis priestleyi]
MSDFVASKFQLSVHQCVAHRLLGWWSCAFVMDCARLYIRQVDGSLPRSRRDTRKGSLRPEQLKSGLIARIPAI